MTSIQVAVRVRPFNSREVKYSSGLIIDMKGLKNTEVFESKGGKVNTTVPPRKFNFDYCFWTHNKEDCVMPEIDPSTRDITDNNVLKAEGKIYADQQFVYSQLGLPILDNCLKGFNACLFAYGQTGSGKTYTMMGIPADPGVIPQMCMDLFGRADALKANGGSITVTCSYMEIYNEIVRDLLNPASIDLPGGLKVRQHPTLGVFVQDLKKLTVTTADEISKLLDDGGQVRAVASTNMNASSSRSHAILTLQILVKDKNGSEVGSVLNLVDLAGSERAGSTGAEGATLVEGANINKSLTTLGMCLSRLADAAENSKNKQHIPYRDSQLTWLLNDSLGGNSKTAMLANISPASINYDETLSTLRFAMTVKKIKNNAVINEDPQQKLIRELRAEIEEIKVKILELEAGGFGESPSRALSVAAIEDVAAEGTAASEPRAASSSAAPKTDADGSTAAPPVLDADGNIVPAEEIAADGAATSVEPTEPEAEDNSTAAGHTDDDGGDSAEDQLEKLELAARLIEEAQETPAEKAKRAAAEKAEHEKAMAALNQKSGGGGVVVDNSAPRLVTLNEDLHTMPTVALMYYLKEATNRVGCGNDKKAVLVRLPSEVGRERIQLFHAVIEVNLLAKKVFIRACGEAEQPTDMETTEEAMFLATSTMRRGSTTARGTMRLGGTQTLQGLAGTLKNLNINMEDGTYTAPIFVNGQLLGPDDPPRELRHKDRIVIGSIAFRHSQPPNWYVEGLDDEFSRETQSTDHLVLLERFLRADIQIKYMRELEQMNIGAYFAATSTNNSSSPTAAGTPVAPTPPSEVPAAADAAEEPSDSEATKEAKEAARRAAIAHITEAIAEATNAELSDLLDTAANDENVLIERYPVRENEVAERAAKAAAQNTGLEYDYAFAIAERDERIRKIIIAQQSTQREEQLTKLKEQAKDSEEEIERLKTQLAQQEKAKAEALAAKKEKEEQVAREVAKNVAKQKEASEKTSSMLMIANELQMYEEQVRVATMWKPTGPSPSYPADVEEYKASLADPQYQQISADVSPERALVMPPIVAWKMRLEHGVLGRLRSGWHRVFILVRPRFIYYFTKNEPKQVANGAAYLFGCQLNVLSEPVEGKQHVLRVIPCIPRKLSKSSKGETDDNNVLFAFDSAEDLLKLRLHIENVYRPQCPPRVAEFLRKQDAAADGGSGREEGQWEMLGTRGSLSGNQ